jgi:formamidopyrimidine-DNA glycosylase
MPELPEVETIRRGLLPRVKGKKIAAVEVRKPKMVRGKRKEFVSFVKGKSFSGITRRGKLLIFSIANRERYMLVHLKMTGQLIYQSDKETIAGGHQWPPVAGNLPNKYSHIIFTFADGSRLYFNDLRQFGYVHIVNEKEKENVLTHYGLEPLRSDFTWEKFRAAMKGKTSILKASLLSQESIAGVGNIYVDEISFHARIRPQRRTSSLSEKELKALYEATKHVLTRAMKYGGTTFRDYLNAEGGKGNFTQLLKVYGRGGEPCKRCGTVLKRVKVMGRGTVYCQTCQK